MHKKKNDCLGAHKRDPISGITGGLILILIGTLFLLSTLDIISWGIWWAYFLLGLGVIFILDAVVRSTSSSYRKDARGKLLAGVVLIIIGGANIFGFVSWWPLILIAAGVFLFFSSLKQVKK